MKFAYTRLVAADLPRLASFYERLLGIEPHGDARYVEFRPGGAILALVTAEACAFLHGGEWAGAANRSAILEFAVEDVDLEYRRIGAFVTDWIQPPRDMPWGNRSMLFRDPEGNPINFFKPSAA